MFWSRLVAFCTAPRAALACYLAVLATFIIVTQAEIPLGGALDAAVAVAKYEADPCAKTLVALNGAPLGSFEGRWFGYSVEDGRRVLCVMRLNDGAAAQAYLGRHFPIDMVYPTIYGPALAVIWAYLLGAYGLRRWGWRWLTAAPLIAAAFDVAETLSVRALVLAGPEATAGAIESASTLTQLKYGFTALIFLPALALLTLHLFRRAV